MVSWARTPLLKKQVVPSKVLTENCQGLGCTCPCQGRIYFDNEQFITLSHEQILDDTGFLYVWFQPANVDHTQFIAELEQCLTDQYKQNWESELQATTGKLRITNKLSNTSGWKCILIFHCMHLRIPVANLRTSSHLMRIETGRYNLPVALPPDKRSCWFCDDDSMEENFFFFQVQTLHILTRFTRAHSPLLSTESILYAFERLGQMEVYFLMYSENKLVCLHSTFVSVAFKLRRNCIMILMLPVMST